MPLANRQEVGGLQWLALNGRDLEEGSDASWGRSKQFILDEKAVDAARAQFERIWKEQERAVVAIATAAYTTRMQHLAQRSAAARKYSLVHTLHSDSIFTHKPREYIIQCFSQKSIITLRLRGGSTLQRSSNVTVCVCARACIMYMICIYIIFINIYYIFINIYYIFISY
jgi:hypothetical protein